MMPPLTNQSNPFLRRPETGLARKGQGSWWYLFKFGAQ